MIVKEKILKQYKGFTIQKSVDDKRKSYYDAYDKDGDYFDGALSLNDIKKKIDNYIK